ncbi:MAG: lysophospholipid acyltransferase family protein, partial [Candidatus Korobacteraceae bacterium]
MISAPIMLAFWGFSILLVGPWLLLYAFLTKDVRPLYHVATFLAITGVRLAGIRIREVGKENIKRGQNYIFMSNHASNLDPPIEIPRIQQRCSVLVKKELFRVPILGTGMHLAQLVPVDRSNREAAIESVREGVEVLRTGLNMMIYPEGTRTPNGKLLPFKKGPFHLAMESGVPVLPMTILGTYEAWPKHRFALKSGVVTVIYHPAIDPKSYADRD